MNRIIDVSGAAISPDGKYIAYLASHNELDRNLEVDVLHLVDVATRADTAVSFHHDSYSNLVWSRDDRLAYVADDKASSVSQVYVIDPQGNRETELTSGTTDVSQAAWSPNGQTIAFTRPDAAPKKTGAAMYEDAFEVSDNAYLATKAAPRVHLWTVSMSGAERQLTSGASSVRDDGPPAWSPDGRFIVYARAPNGIGADSDLSYLERVDVATRDMSRVTQSRDVNQAAALYDPSGRFIAYQYPQNGVIPAQYDAMVVSASGGPARNAAAALDRNVEEFAWFNASTLLLRIYDHTRARLMLQPLNGNAREVPTGAVADAMIGSQPVSDAGGIVFTGSTPTRPSELYYLAPNSRAPVRLSHWNDETAALTLAKQTQITYRNGRFTEYAVLTYPPHYDPHTRYPLVLRVHGGPQLTSLVAFDPWHQLAAARGYITLAPNYRGSSDNGNAFESSILDDASSGPGTDIMAAIDAVKRMNVIDPNRIGISGWSYGGQMTTWMIGHYNVFKVAVAGAPVTDLVVDYAIADDILDDRGFFGYSPNDPGKLAIYRGQSPITYAANIHTPTLLMSNVYDVRVPAVENYELFHALRDRGVPVKFYVYPTTGHLPKGPVRYADAYRRWLDWFDTYLHPTPP